MKPNTLYEGSTRPASKAYFSSTHTTNSDGYQRSVLSEAFLEPNPLYEKDTSASTARQPVPPSRKSSSSSSLSSSPSLFSASPASYEHVTKVAAESFLRSPSATSHASRATVYESDFEQPPLARKRDESDFEQPPLARKRDESDFENPPDLREINTTRPGVFVRSSRGSIMYPEGRLRGDAAVGGNKNTRTNNNNENNNSNSNDVEENDYEQPDAPNTYVPYVPNNSRLQRQQQSLYAPIQESMMAGNSKSQAQSLLRRQMIKLSVSAARVKLEKKIGEVSEMKNQKKRSDGVCVSCWLHQFFFFFGGSPSVLFQGQFGDVYLGTLDGLCVAVKTVKASEGWVANRILKYSNIYVILALCVF